MQGCTIFSHIPLVKFLKGLACFLASEGIFFSDHNLVLTNELFGYLSSLSLFKQLFW